MILSSFLNFMSIVKKKEAFWKILTDRQTDKCIDKQTHESKEFSFANYKIDRISRSMWGWGEGVLLKCYQCLQAT